MAVNGSAEVRRLSQLELMGHLFRRAGFGATRGELEAALAKGYEARASECPAQWSAPGVREGENACKLPIHRMLQFLVYASQ